MSCTLARRASRIGLATFAALVAAVSVACTAPGHATTVPARALAAVGPKYFIDNVLSSGSATGAGFPQVRLATTGALVSQPVDIQALAIAPLGSHGAFIIAEPASSGCGSRLYRSTLSATGQLGTPSLLRTVPDFVESMAADADGTTVGFTAASCTKPVSGYVGVLDIRTGALRHWGSAGANGSPASISIGTGLSMSASGGLLAFTGSTAAAGGTAATQGVWVLKTTSPVGDLARYSRRVLTTSASGPALDSVILAPGGGAFYLCAVHATQNTQSSKIAAYRTADGRLTGTIATLTGSGNGPLGPTLGCPMTADPGVTQLLVPYSLKLASKPEIGALVRVARVDIATRSVARFSFRLPGSAGMSVPDRIAVAW